MRAEPFLDEDLTENAFLGGRVRLLQPREGYRAGIDPVLLAASVPAQEGQSVLELGCGGGVGLLCLAARVAGLDLTGVEYQPAYAALARRNAALNDASVQVCEADLTALPTDVRQRSFDHVFANPPYYEAGARSAARDPGREAGLAGGTPLAQWVSAAARRVMQGGTVSFIHSAEATPALLGLMQGHLGTLELLPIAPREGRPARLVICRGRKGGRSPFRLYPPLILHRGDRHMRDEDDFSERLSKILRNGEALIFSAETLC